MLTLKNLSGPRLIQLTLSSGIALIVISMLFMGRGQESTSFIEQAVSVLAFPAIFYLIGIVVYRFLDAPLAAPGIVATGAWLIGVGVIHLYDKRNLMPDLLQPYYWLAASLTAAALITATGHRVRTWLIVPLVPLAQANALWAVLLALSVDVRWMPALSFLLLLVWWELPLSDNWWRSIYRASAAVLAVLLMLFTIWLPMTTPQSLMITWGACATVVVIIGLQNGWLSFGPLAFVILTGASIWGLPASVWPVVWLLFAVGTIVFIERRVASSENRENTRTLELSRALAVLLSASAGLVAQGGWLFGVSIHLLAIAAVLAAAGVLLIWLGLQRELLTATHGGLWLLVAAWINLYGAVAPTNGLYGLWLALFAACGLLVQRVAASRRKDKHKGSQTILHTITSWPVADMAIGVSTIVLLWTVFQISVVDTGILTVTFAVIIGVWIATGLLYRLPVLLHIALWVLPIPYAMLAILLAPAFWTLPYLGVAWQLLGAGLLILGHLSPRYRPQLLAPFFIVGYFLLGFGFTIAIANAALLPISLTIIVIASTATSAAVILGYHPAWTALVQWIIPPESRPYAFRHVYHLFLFLSAWIGAFWLNLMLGYASLSLPRQGICLVLFSCIWFITARLLTRVSKIVVWPIIAAGWLLWLVGLLEVYYSPTEAFVTVILGLIISGESLRRTRDVFWVPVFIIQLLFTALQVAWVLTLPGFLILLVVGVGISIAGMILERRLPQSGRAAAITGGLTALGVWLLHDNLSTTLLITALPVVAMVTYRRWKWLWAVYLGLYIALAQSDIQLSWLGIFIAGVVQWIIGAELLRSLRPRRFRTFKRAFSLEQDWATPFLWIGSICAFIGVVLSVERGDFEPAFVGLILAAVFAVYTIRLRIFYLSYLSLAAIAFGGLAFGIKVSIIHFLPINPDTRVLVGCVLALIAVFVRWLCVHAITTRSYVRWTVLWIKPLLASTYVLCGLSATYLVTTGNHATTIELIANCLLLEIFTLMVYSRTHKITWLWIACGAAAYGWLFLLSQASLTNPAWKTLPLGMALLILARASRQKSLEYAGCLVWLAGIVVSLDRTHLISLTSVGAGLHIVSLLAYGYLDGRRVPFIGGSLALLASLLFLVSKINPWLIPFAGGSLLLGASLLFEVQRETAERWLSKGVARWQQWR